MAKSRPLTIVFPSGGVNKRYGFHKQAPFTTPSANNIWPSQWETGRERGGVRPGITQLGDAGGSPYNWCEANWAVDTSDPDSGNVSVAITTSTGTKVRRASDNSWTAKSITTNPGSDFASCAVYLQDLYQASGAKTKVRVKPLHPDSFIGGTFDSESTRDLDTPEDDIEAGELYGEVPENCGLVLAWGDRLVLAGDTTDPQLIYMCKVGNPRNWDYSAVDASAAWANSGGTAGLIGENITALINHNQDCLLVGCTDSLYAIRGNPRLSSVPVYSLSTSVGPLMQSAWCKTGNDFTVMMTRDGLYSMRPGCGEPPVSISRETLPEDLTAINPGDGDRVSIGYDSRWRGIHIYVNWDNGDNSYWFYDLQNKGYWPMTFSKEMRLAVNFKGVASQTKSGLLAVASDGKPYQFDINSSEDITSHLYYGPIAIGSPHTEGVLSEVAAVLAEDSDDVAWEVYAADSPQQAFHLDSPSFVGKNWNIQGLNYTQNPLVRGSAMYLKASGISEGSQHGRWTIEEIPIIVRQAGRRRVG